MRECAPYDFFDLGKIAGESGRIADYAYHGDQNLEKLWVPRTILSIGTCAFSGCTKLKEIRFEGGGEYGLDIGLMAFASCGSLVEVELPSRTRTIGKGGFRDCCALGRIGIKEGSCLLQLGDHLFDNCPGRDEMNAALAFEVKRRAELVSWQNSIAEQKGERRDRAIIERLMLEFPAAEEAARFDERWGVEKRGAFECRIRQIYDLSMGEMRRLMKIEPRIAAFFPWQREMSRHPFYGDDDIYVCEDWCWLRGRDMERVLTACPWIARIGMFYDGYDGGTWIRYLFECYWFFERLNGKSWARILCATNQLDEWASWGALDKSMWLSLLERRPELGAHLYSSRLKPAAIAEIIGRRKVVMDGVRWVELLRRNEGLLKYLHHQELDAMSWFAVLHDFPAAAEYSPYSSWDCPSLLEALKHVSEEELPDDILVPLMLVQPERIERVADWSHFRVKHWKAFLAAEESIRERIIKCVMEKTPYLPTDVWSSATGSEDLPVVAFYSGDRGTVRTAGEWIYLGDEPALCTYESIDACEDFMSEFCRSRYFFIKPFGGGCSDCGIRSITKDIYSILDANGRPAEYWVILRR